MVCLVCTGCVVPVPPPRLSGIKASVSTPAITKRLRKKFGKTNQKSETGSAVDSPSGGSGNDSGYGTGSTERRRRRSGFGLSRSKSNFTFTKHNQDGVDTLDQAGVNQWSPKPSNQWTPNPSPLQSHILPDIVLNGTYWKCNFPLTPHVPLSVGRLVCRSVCLSQFPKKGGKLHFHAPFGALVDIRTFCIVEVILFLFYFSSVSN